MYISLPTSLTLFLFSSLAIAQTTTFTTSPSVTQSTSSATTSVCADQPVLDTCLASTEALANACQSTDYLCLCQKWNAVVICYNDCPNDPGLSSANSTESSYCSQAAVYGTTTFLQVSSSSSSGSSATTTSASVTETGSTKTTGSATATGTGGFSQATGAAVNLRVIGTGGMLAAVAGVVVVYL